MQIHRRTNAVQSLSTLHNFFLKESRAVQLVQKSTVQSNYKLHVGVIPARNQSIRSGCR
jgi:hypothetical protein